MDEATECPVLMPPNLLRTCQEQKRQHEATTLSFFCGKVFPNENNHAMTAGFFTIFSNIIFYKDFRAKIKEEYL